MKLLFISIYIFLLFFSPKIGVFDIRICLVPFAILFSINYFTIPKFLFFLITNVIILIFYYIIISVYNKSDLIEILRYFRVIISIFLIIALFSFPFITRNLIFNAIFIVFGINCLVMIANLIFPSFHIFIQGLYFENDKILDKSYRVIGLSSGFDTSGIILLISVLFFSYLSFKHHLKKYFLFLIIGIFLCFFVSRATIIYFFAILFFLLYRLTIKFKYKNISIIYFYIFIIFLIMYPLIYNIFLSSVNLDFLGIEADINSDIIENTYAKTDIFEMLNSFFILPNSSSGLIFGIAKDVEVDSGYIKTINQIGILGALITFIIHWKTYFSFKKKYSKNIFISFKFMLLLILILISVSNIKNQMFFIRGIFEIYITLCMLYFKYDEA